jgi:hypothetical protein
MIFNPIDHPICFEKPKYISGHSAWVEHIPFAFVIISLLRPKIFVELGSHYGDSYCAFCQAVEDLKLPTACYAVDTWQGDEHSRIYGPEVLHTLRQHHDAEYGSFSNLIQSTFDDATRHFQDGSIDLLHIDGLHTYDAVKHDFETWLPKISRAGVVLFHDTNVRERDFGVWRLWSELKENYPNYEFLHGHGLGVLAVGDKIPVQLKSLLETEGDTKQTISRLFSKLGASVAQERCSNSHISALAQSVTEREGQIAGLNQAVGERDAQIANLYQVVAELDMQIAALAAIREKMLSWQITKSLRYIGHQLKRIRHVWRISLSLIQRGGGASTAINAIKLLHNEGLAGVKQRIVQVQHHPSNNLASHGNSEGISVHNLINSRFTALIPLRIYSLPPTHQARCVNIVTDSVGSSSLFGGVGTALIFAALLANKLDAKLRIVTRTERALPANVDSILTLYGIKLKQEIQFKFAAPYDQKYEIDVAKDDLFITTSWWTTAATLRSVPHESIIYLLQEDERMFYPFGDDRFQCESILSNRDIRFLINTKLLFDHFAKSGLINITRRGKWFEPAFPAQVFYPRKKAQGEKRKFFFYARPNNLRNLFYLGVDVIEQAVTQQVLNLDQWEIILIGKDIPNVSFCNGYVPTKIENLPWSAYAELVGTADLGLSLMYTPHPSYPPLDLAASGAVVVTNRFANKRDLSMYSPNLICAEMDKDSLVEGIRKAVVIATDPHLREKNYRNNKIVTDWHSSFANIIEELSGVA